MSMFCAIVFMTSLPDKCCGSESYNALSQMPAFTGVQCKQIETRGFLESFVADSSTNYLWWNKTVCQTSESQGIVIEYIINSLPLNETRHLIIFVNNLWDGKFPITVPNLDITNITRFFNLESFELIYIWSEFSKDYNISFLGLRDLGFDNLSKLFFNIHPKAVKNLKILQLPSLQLVTTYKYRIDVDFSG